MADKRVKYDPQEKERWFKSRREGKSVTEIAEIFGVPIGTISSNCTLVGAYPPGSGPGKKVRKSKKFKEDTKDAGEEKSEDSFAGLEAAFIGIQAAAVEFVQKHHQELIIQNAELTSRLAESKEECKKLKDAVLEERGSNSGWKARLKAF